MHYPDKARQLAETYFRTFPCLFGKTPNFPSGEEQQASLDTLTRIINDGLNKYGSDPAVLRIIDCDALDFMEELINSYE